MGVACVVIIGAASGVAAAVVDSSSSPADESPLQLAPSQGAAPSLGTDAASILSTIKARVPNVVSLDLQKDPITSGSGTSTFNALVAHTEIAESAAGGAGDAQAMWAGNLIGGALKTASSQAGLAVPESVDVTLLRPDGTTDHIGGGIGNVVPNQVFDAATLALQSTVLQNAAQLGYANVKFSTFQVIDDVVEITASTSADPAAAANAFMKAGGLDGLLGQSANNYESVYFELDDASGNPLLIDAANARAGSGVYWADSSTGLQNEGLNTSSASSN